MTPIFAFDRVTKRYAGCAALDDLTLTVARPSIIGLVGKNGSGKTTLLNHVVGLVLPTSGVCTTFGCPTPRLGAAELARIGVVHQRSTFLAWMRVEELLRYVASFYERWDMALERRLVAELELDSTARVGALSPGTLQKLALVVALGHRPPLLLLDEPLSDLDPIARRSVLMSILEYFDADATTIVISSHLLHDLETVVDRIVCLDGGRLTADAPLDELMERYAEWTVTSRSGQLPRQWTEPYVRSAQGDRFRALLVVEEPAYHLEAFRATYDVEVDSRPLTLERIFPLLTSNGAAAGGPSDHTAVLVAAP